MIMFTSILLCTDSADETTELFCFCEETQHSSTIPPADGLNYQNMALNQTTLDNDLTTKHDATDGDLNTCVTTRGLVGEIAWIGVWFARSINVYGVSLVNASSDGR